MTPIEIGKFFKTPRHSGDVIVGSIREYEGRKFADFRLHYTDRDGCMKPTKKGLALSLRKLEEFAELIAKTITKARELGLIRQEDEP